MNAILKEKREEKAKPLPEGEMEDDLTALRGTIMKVFKKHGIDQKYSSEVFAVIRRATGRDVNR